MGKCQNSWSNQTTTHQTTAFNPFLWALKKVARLGNCQNFMVAEREKSFLLSTLEVFFGLFRPVSGYPIYNLEAGAQTTDQTILRRKSAFPERMRMKLQENMASCCKEPLAIYHFAKWRIRNSSISRWDFTLINF